MIILFNSPCFYGDVASVFGEQRKLEPMSPDRKARWVKEIGWLLSVTDHIVEFVPSQQNGTNMEVKIYFNFLYIIRSPRTLI